MSSGKMVNCEKGRELSWLAERWSAALAAAIEETGTEVAGREWRFAEDPAQLDASKPGALWWKECVGAGFHESVSVGLGPAARESLAAAVDAAGSEPPSLPGLVERAAQIVKGTRSRVALELSGASAGGQTYCIRLRPASGAVIEVALACLGGVRRGAR